MRNRIWKGLKGIEILLIVFFLALLVYVIMSRYNDFARVSMRSEVKFSLGQIHGAQKLYHTSHDRYARFDVLIHDEKRVVLPQRYYVFSDAKEPSKDSFLVIAMGAKGSLVAGEVWTINESNEIRELGIDAQPE